MLPLTLEDVVTDPSLSNLELKASLFHPLVMLPCSPSGLNLFCCANGSALAVAAPALAYGITGGAYVPKLRCVGARGTPVPVASVASAASAALISSA